MGGIGQFGKVPRHIQEQLKPLVDNIFVQKKNTATFSYGSAGLLF